MLGFISRLILFSQAVLVNKVLEYIETPETSTLSYGTGLAFALFFTEFCKAFFISLMWALNVRTAVRLKSAFSTMAFEKIISLRVQSDVSNGEVRRREPTNHTRYFKAASPEVGKLSPRGHMWPDE